MRGLSLISIIILGGLVFIPVTVALGQDPLDPFTTPGTGATAGREPGGLPQTPTPAQTPAPAMITPTPITQSVTDIFLQLPDSECNDFSPAERKAILETSTQTTPGGAGRASVPDPNKPWIHIYSNQFMVLNRPGLDGTITYKLFNGNGFTLIAICRGRQRYGVVDPACRFDLCLYVLDNRGLSRAEHHKYLPGITILDFITMDTLTDPRARSSIAARGPTYGQCLTCNANLSNPGSLDIITTTTINAKACDSFLPTYGILPLTWNGSHFTKPYNRASPRGE